jgi:hypothetical protein
MESNGCRRASALWRYVRPPGRAVVGNDAGRGKSGVPARRSEALASDGSLRRPLGPSSLVRT